MERANQDFCFPQQSEEFLVGLLNGGTCFTHDGTKGKYEDLLALSSGGYKGAVQVFKL